MGKGESRLTGNLEPALKHPPFRTGAYSGIIDFNKDIVFLHYRKIEFSDIN
jgi:hypothetical protein